MRADTKTDRKDKGVCGKQLCWLMIEQVRERVKEQWREIHLRDVNY